MRVTVIIPNFNGEKYIIKCISSLLKQSFNDYEIIIVDNASKDQSVKLIQEISKDSKIKINLIENNENLGFAIAVNQGIKFSNSEYIVLFNNDAFANEDFLFNLIDTIEKDNEIFSVCGKMVRFYENNIIDDAGDFYTPMGWAFKRGDGFSAKKYYRETAVFSCCGGAVIYRRSILEEIGYFDEMFFAYLEDVDIGFRAMIYGYKNVYNPKAKVTHVVSGTTSKKYNALKSFTSARNGIYVIYKNMPFLMIIINFLFIFLGYIVKIIFTLKNGYTREYLLGIKEGLIVARKIRKVKFKIENINNYLKIQLFMFISLFKYIYYRFMLLKHKFCKHDEVF